MPPVAQQIMHFSLEFWQIILLCGMLIGAFWAAFSLAFRFYKTSVELQLAAVKLQTASVRAELEAEIKHLASEVTDLKSGHKQITSQMLLREDWIRESVANHQVQDQLRIQMQQVMNILVTM